MTTLLFGLTAISNNRSAALDAVNQFLGALELSYSYCLGTFGSSFFVEADAVTFRQALKALSLDGRVMNEEFFPVIPRDKSITFTVIEPLYSTFSHGVLPFFCFT